MAHEIFGERIVLRDKPAWHGLGEVFTEDISPLEAAERAGWYDYDVQKLPVRLNVPADWLELLPEGMRSDDLLDEWNEPQTWAIVRSPTTDDPKPVVFAHVSDLYSLLPNSELARILNPLADEWNVETAAVLTNGSQVFMTLRAGTVEINGDELTEYFFFTNDHSGKEGVRAGFTPVRIVCQNTLTTGTSQATEMVTLSHTGDILEKAEFHVELMQNLRRAREKTLDFFQLMGDVTLEDDEIENVLQAAWPHEDPSDSVLMYQDIIGATDGDAGLEALMEKYPRQHQRLTKLHTDWQSRNRRAAERREAAHERLEFWNDRNPQYANSAWNVWAGAVTEVADWRDGRDDFAHSIVFGSRAAEKERAFRAIADMFSTN